MPPRKKPHPRSLDALFPRPARKVAVKRCAWGHSQTPDWRTVQGCSTCRKREEAEAKRAALSGDAGKAEREEWYRNNPIPDVLTITETSTGRVFRYVIPPHCRKRRGPGGRGRIKRRP